jgi:hypothetical protein
MSARAVDQESSQTQEETSIPAMFSLSRAARWEPECGDCHGRFEMSQALAASVSTEAALALVVVVDGAEAFSLTTVDR